LLVGHRRKNRTTPVLPDATRDGAVVVETEPVGAVGPTYTDRPMFVKFIIQYSATWTGRTGAKRVGNLNPVTDFNFENGIGENAHLGKVIIRGYAQAHFDFRRKHVGNPDGAAVYQGVPKVSGALSRELACGNQVNFPGAVIVNGICQGNIKIERRITNRRDPTRPPSSRW